ncbi:MAG: aminopeptidase P family protein [Lachnospiraceae bacterium]|nr:aminopeptidase P family protein [Lachnospiraceae bacterium]
MNVEDKLNALRNLMKERNFSAYIIPTEDFHSSEYVGEYFKAREYMSGFTGSAGTLIVLPDEAALWTDGRYFIQADDQLRDSSVVLMRSGQPGVPTMAEYLSDHLQEKSIIGFDGRTVTERFVQTIAEKTDEKQITFDGREDLVDFIWSDRPPISTEPVRELDAKYTGRSREEKLADVHEKMHAEKADILLLTALDEIAWLTNLRGNDVLHTPVFLAYMLLTMDEVYLFIHEQILSDEIRSKLTRAGITVEPYDAIEQKLHDIATGSKVWIDSGCVNYRLMNSLPDNVEKIDKSSPIVLMKAVKTPQEMKHIRTAHVKDGVAVTRFMHWLKTSVDKEKITEISAAEKLETFREQSEGYLGPSFEPIIAYGVHGAIVHYEPTEQTDVEMKEGSFCLADTGGHYNEGTTDVTRTFALGTVTEEEKRYYTMVLRGHLAFGAAKFVHGICGRNLDVLARGPLWEAGLDYNHGTGHGVGFVLSVHEGPQRIHWRMSENTQIALEEGMVISNEPGIYLEGRFGIRHENLVFCRKGEKNEYGQFMYLEPLTMVPFDRDAILPELMSDRELKWLNDYHSKVYETLSPHFNGEELKWLREATAKIVK